MTRRRPVPDHLGNRVFSRTEARAAGLSDRRLTYEDIERVSHGLYRVRSETPPETVNQLAELKSYQRRAPSLWVSHHSAAQIYHAPLPRSAEVAQIHISSLHALASVSDVPHVVANRPRFVDPREIRNVEGLRVSCPERTFLELATRLRIKDLIIAGDHLVRLPRIALENRTTPWTTPDSLRSYLDFRRGSNGVVAARHALEQVRIGSDSPPETLLRLEITDSGLPEPQLQVPLGHRHKRHEGDMGYITERVILQYEGEHHFTAEQQARDERRNAAFEHAGWTVIRVNRVDLAEGFRTVITRLARLLETAA